MARVVVSAFDSRRDADAVRRRLLERGLTDARIRIEGVETAAPPDRGLVGFIERMFSGLLTGVDELGRPARASNRKALVVLHVPDAAAAARAAAILDEIGKEIGRPVFSGTVVSSVSTSPVSRDDNDGPYAFDIIATVLGPEIYPLPNSPTGWGEATHGAKAVLGEIPNDPGRPEGLIWDAGGLGTDGYREVGGGEKR